MGIWGSIGRAMPVRAGEVQAWQGRGFVGVFGNVPAGQHLPRGQGAGDVLVDAWPGRTVRGGNDHRLWPGGRFLAEKFHLLFRRGGVGGIVFAVTHIRAVALLDGRRDHQLHYVDAPALEELNQPRLADAIDAIGSRMARQPALGDPLAHFPTRRAQKVSHLVGSKQSLLHVP